MAQSQEQALIKLASPDGSYQVEVNLSGGFVQHASHQGMEIFYAAGWWHDRKEDLSALPAMMSHLGGEFTCVPFGAVEHDWANFRAAYPHGLSCNVPYELVKSDAHQAVMAVKYPEDFDVEKIVKTVTCTDEGVKVSVEIFARRAVSLPAGEHPCFVTEDGALLKVAGAGVTYFKEVEPGISHALPHTPFAALDAVPCRDGSTLDCTSLPLPYDTEEIVQMYESAGEARIFRKAHDKTVVFTWDSTKLPSCLLWMSNRGRAYFPWNSSNVCLGIEPIASAWDSPELSVKGDEVLKSRGIKTLLDLDPKQPVVLNFSYQVLPHDAR